MPLLRHNAVLAIKVEVTEGSAVSPAAGDAILVFDPVFTPGIERHDRMPVAASLSPYNPISGKRQATMSFAVEIKGSGTAGTAPEWGPCLLGCKMAEAIAAGTSVTYTPASSSDDSYTLSLYEDGVLYKMWGARGTFTIDCIAGQPGRVNFVFTGADFSVDDASVLSGMSYDATTPPAFLSAAFSISAYSAIIETLNLDIGNNVVLRPSANASSGNLSAYVASRMPKGTIDPEMVLVATEDFFADWRAGTLAAMTATIGASAGNICTITAPKVAYREISPADRGGIRTQQINFDLTKNSGDDELSIAFT
jgi:hypothetical protein